jgi:hypothetical protein
MELMVGRSEQHRFDPLEPKVGSLADGQPLVRLMFTSFKDLTSAVVSGECAADRHVVVVAMMLGCWTLVLLQTIGMHFANAIWWMAKR